MRVQIQKTKEGEFPNINFFQANEGFKELGYDIQCFWFCPESKKPYFVGTSLPVDFVSHTVVVGGVPVICLAYEQLGVQNPHLESYPDSLKDFLYRGVNKAKVSTLSLPYLDGFTGPVFVKPLDKDQKRFTGFLLKDSLGLLRMRGLDEVYISNVVNFKSEYRVFVHHGEMVELKHYRGDFTVFPDIRVIKEMIAEYNDAPVAYALDVGVLDNGRTALVEINDSSSLGCYGLGPVTYAKMISDRWDQVICGN